VAITYVAGFRYFPFVYRPQSTRANRRLGTRCKDSRARPLNARNGAIGRGPVAPAVPPAAAARRAIGIVPASRPGGRAGALPPGMPSRRWPSWPAGNACRGAAVVRDGVVTGMVPSPAGPAAPVRAGISHRTVAGASRLGLLTPHSSRPGHFMIVYRQRPARRDIVPLVPISGISSHWRAAESMPSR
jgi:hypothetical protein